MPADLHDADWLTGQCATRTASSIADELGVSVHTVLRAMRLHRIPVRHAKSKRPPVRPELDDPEWLAERYANGPVKAIADELGVAEATANRALVRHGIPIRERGEALRRRMPAELYDADWLRQQYATKSGGQIADELGVSKPAIHKAFRRAGIETDGPWVRRAATRITPPTKKQLERSWAANGTIKAVAIEFGVSPGKAAVWLADVGIFLHAEPAISKKDLLAQIAAGKGIQQIAADVRLADRTVMVELRRHGLTEQHRLRGTGQG